MKKALITGITGQDGAYLAELLLQKGYEVHGIKRRTSLINTQRVDHLYQDPHEKNLKMILHYGDLTDSTNIIRIVQQVQPDEIYNLGAMSHVQVSFEEPEYVANTDATGTLRLLEAIRILGLQQKNQNLSGIYIRAIRKSSGSSPKRNDSFLPSKSICRCQIICVLDHG